MKKHPTGNTQHARITNACHTALRRGIQKSIVRFGFRIKCGMTDEAPSTINQKPSAAQSAFTLVELAIVIVIIGVLVTGVLKGQELIQQSKNRTILSDMEGYKSAIFMFKDKFGQYPGDTTRAFAIWGSACDAVQTNCDGDGDGRILNTNGTNATNDMEQTRVWQHLSLARLIKGTYVGVGQPGWINGGTSPKGPLEFSGYIIENGNTIGWIIANSLIDKNYIRFGNCANTAMGSGRLCSVVPIINPTSMFSIDTKIDDGKPDLGLITTVQTPAFTNIYFPNCKTGSEPNSIYNIIYEGAACTIHYAID